MHSLTLSILLCLCFVAIPHKAIGQSFFGSSINILDECLLRAQDAFNFNDFLDCGGSCLIFDNYGEQTSGGFACGYSGGPICPTHLATGGPNRNGSAYIFSDTNPSYTRVGLDFDDKAWHDYSRVGGTNELTVAFHFKALRTPNLSYGWFGSPVVWTSGESYIGSDGAGFHAERICMNITDVVDKGGADNYSTDCGATVDGTNNGLGATTGVLSVPQGVWQYAAFVFDGEDNPGDDDGTYRVYLNNMLVASEDLIEGEIINTTNKWTIGNGVSSYFSFTDYEIDNLQIDNVAWDLARVIQGNCDVADRF